MAELELFLSWSRPSSQQASEALKDWLPDVLPDIRPWMSKEDITKGTPWFSSISVQLARSRVCLICVTQENLGSPWLYYEAGAIAHAMQGSLICPYLLGIDPGKITGTPLGQYQCTTFDKDDTWRLIRSINSVFEPPHNEKLLNGNFDSKWASLQKKFAKILTGLAEVDSQTKTPDVELSSEARLILVEASYDRGGHVLMIKTSGGFSVQTNGKQLCDRNDPRTEAAFRSAIKELVGRNLLELRGSKGETLALTKSGFELADHLKSQAVTTETPQSYAATEDSDILCLLQGWLGNRTESQNHGTISFEEVDLQLKLSPGSAARLLETAAQKYQLQIDQKGPKYIVFRPIIPRSAAPVVSNPGWDDPRNPFGRRR
jgi:hypothetical protein